MRRAYLVSLRIPTFGGFKRVLFYDTLQQMCLQINAYNKDKVAIEKMKLQSSVLHALKSASINSDTDMKTKLLEQVAKEEEENNDMMDIDDVINSLHVMSSRIELLQQLKERVKNNFNTYFEKVDTNLNIHLSEEERLTSGQGRFMNVLSTLEDQKLEVNVFSRKDIQLTDISAHIDGLDEKIIRTAREKPIQVVIYTTDVYYGGLTILKRYRELKKRRAIARGEDVTAFPEVHTEVRLDT